MYAKKIREINRVANKNSTQTSLNVILDNNVKFSKKNKRFFRNYCCIYQTIIKK